MNKAKTDIWRTSTNLRRLLTCLLITLAVLLLLERFGAIGLQLATRGFTGDLPRRLAAQGVAACPELAYLLALWWIRQTLVAFAAGQLYSQAVTRMLDRVGTMLAAGALINIFIVPSASRALGFGPGYLIPMTSPALSSPPWVCRSKSSPTSYGAPRKCRPNSRRSSRCQSESPSTKPSATGR